MTHLRIEQSDSATEQVSSAVIKKLYDLAISGDLDNTSDLLGRLHTTVTYKEYVDVLCKSLLNPSGMFPNLYISSDNYYILFLDPEVERILKDSIGDGVGVTLALAAACRNLDGIGLNYNTNITSFNELLYFTSLTSLPKFSGDTNLLSILLSSSITSITYDALYDCTSLTTLGDTSNLTNFNPILSRNMYSLMLDDTKLNNLTGNFRVLGAPLCGPTEEFTISALGLNGSVLLEGFAGRKLTITSPITGISASYSTNLVEVVLPNTCTTINLNAFKNCTHLTTINFPTGLTEIMPSAFEGCSSLSGTLDLSNTSLLNIRARTFYNTSYTAVVFPTTLTTIGENNNTGPFDSLLLTTVKGLDNVTTLNSGFFRNITNAMYLGKLLTSTRLPVRSLADSSQAARSTSVVLLYLPKFLYNSNNKLEGYWGYVSSTLFSYQGRDGTNYTTIKLLYFKDLLYIKRLDFYGAKVKNLVINNITPPSFDTSSTLSGDVTQALNYSSWENTMFGTIPTSGTDAMTIYVPDSAVATYQADSNYNSYTIRGINEVDPNTNQPYLTRYATNDLWEAAGKPEDALIEEYMN